MYALAQHIQGHDTQLQVPGRLSNEACDAYRNNPHTNCPETACNLWGAVRAAQTPAQTPVHLLCCIHRCQPRDWQHVTQGLPTRNRGFLGHPGHNAHNRRKALHTAKLAT